MIYTTPLVRPAQTPFQPFEIPTQNGLSYTPSQMNSLTSQGRATSLATMESSAYYQDGTLNEPLPLEFIRGASMNDAFEMEMDSREKVQNFKSQLQTQKNAE